MKELATAIEKAVDDPATFEPLRWAAQRWATFALENLTGESLKKALTVAESIVQFVNEIEPKR